MIGDSKKRVKSVVIIGASTNKDKFGNKAVRSYLKRGWIVYPVNNNAVRVEGLKAFESVSDLPKNVVPDIASFYIPPSAGILVAPEVVKKGIKVVYLNPGSESPELINYFKNNKITPLMVCSIRAIGEKPEDY